MTRDEYANKVRARIEEALSRGLTHEQISVDLKLSDRAVYYYLHRDAIIAKQKARNRANKENSKSGPMCAEFDKAFIRETPEQARMWIDGIVRQLAHKQAAE